MMLIGVIRRRKSVAPIMIIRKRRLAPLSRHVLCVQEGVVVALAQKFIAEQCSIDLLRFCNSGQVRPRRIDSYRSRAGDLTLRGKVRTCREVALSQEGHAKFSVSNDCRLVLQLFGGP